jgi:hypothetical protein
MGPGVNPRAGGDDHQSVAAPSNDGAAALSCIWLWLAVTLVTVGIVLRYTPGGTSDWLIAVGCWLGACWLAAVAVARALG